MQYSETAIWKPVVGYEGLYEVSSDGQIRSLSRVVTTNRIVKGKLQSFTWTSPGKILKFGKRSDDYPDVPLTRNGISVNVCVHRLVAEAFLPNPNDLPEVNHKDGDKRNNCVPNLEWSTYLDNNNHAGDHGLNVQAIRVYCAETDTVYASCNRADKELGLPLGTTATELKRSKFTHGFHFNKI